MRKISRRKALRKLRKIRKNGYKIDSNTERNLRIDMMKSWRRLAFHILVYLSANPEVLAVNNNQEIYDKVRDIQIRYYGRNHSDSSYEDIGKTVDLLVELKIKYEDGAEYFIEQGTMELYRPSTVHSSEWREKVLFEMFFYTISPEIYFKTIHELAMRAEVLGGEEIS